MGARLRGPCRALLAGALAGALAACAASPRPAPAAGPIDPAFEPAFDALRAALEAHDEALSRSILARILARAPSGATLERAEAFGRVIEGRDLCARLQLSLRAEPIGDDGGPGVRFVLEACHDLPEPLEVRSGPGTLRLLLTGLDANGAEERVSRSLVLSGLERLELPAGRSLRLELGDYELPTGLALGVLGECDLRLPPGSILRAGVEYPAAQLQVHGCEVQRLAPWLPSAPVEPGALASYVEAGGRSQAALVERTVRVAPEQREEALDLLAPVALAQSRVDLPRLVPSLRWLSGRRDLGADVDAWRRWLEQRCALLDGSAPDPAGLDLPEPPRGARAAHPSSSEERA